MKSIIAHLDRVASGLELSGRKDLASKIDVVSNTLDTASAIEAARKPRPDWPRVEQEEGNRLASLHYGADKGPQWKAKMTQLAELAKSWALHNPPAPTSEGDLNWDSWLESLEEWNGGPLDTDGKILLRLALGKEGGGPTLQQISRELTPDLIHSMGFIGRSNHLIKSYFDRVPWKELYGYFRDALGHRYTEGFEPLTNA